MGKVTRIEYSHGDRVFTIQEFVDGQKCQYQTKDVWQVVQRLQNMIGENERISYWYREGKE